jgi:hypothetical protein
MSVAKGMPALMHPLYWKDGPPERIADRISQSLPFAGSKWLLKRKIDHICELDKDLIAGIEAKGIRTWRGPEGCGSTELALKRGCAIAVTVNAA